MPLDDLNDEDIEVLLRLLRGAIDAAQPPRVMLKEILGKLRPEPARPAASPEPRVYAPPARGRYRRRD